MLGHPEQARYASAMRDAYARRLGHPFDLGFALVWGAVLLVHLGDFEQALNRLREAERLGREHSLPALTEVHVPFNSGVALIRKGQFAEGITSIKAGLGIWEGSGGRLASPYLKTVLADGMAQLRDLDDALHLIDEVIVQTERSGWEERWYYAETLRVKGWLLARKGELEGAEASYIASLDWARNQQAKAWELRTATSYARLMRDQGRVREAYDLLAPVYGWFTEGFYCPDLKDAKALLDELSSV